MWDSHSQAHRKGGKLGNEATPLTIDAYGHENNNEEEKESQTQKVLGASECVCVCVCVCVCAHNHILNVSDAIGYKDAHKH